VSYSTSSLGGLLDRFGSGEPVPGGGPAAGIAAALGTSLVVMAATLAKAGARTGGAGDLDAAIARLRSLQSELLSLADDDSVAYASVLAAYRLPKQTPAETGTRASAIEVAMQAATDVPLGMMRSCAQVLREAIEVTEQVPRRAHVDLAIGIELIDASLRGCRLCVDANARVLTTAGHRSQVTLESARIQTEAIAHLEQIGAIQQSRRP
jgi:formiminotetrahydrofolate cyclodeaminase